MKANLITKSKSKNKRFILSSHSMSGISTHFIDFNLRPATFSALSITTNNFGRYQSCRRAAPRSSAQALTTPRDGVLGTFSSNCWNHARNGSSAKLKRNAEPGHPWRTPTAHQNQKVTPLRPLVFDSGAL